MVAHSLVMVAKREAATVLPAKSFLDVLCGLVFGIPFAVLLHNLGDDFPSLVAEVVDSRT